MHRHKGVLLVSRKIVAAVAIKSLNLFIAKKLQGGMKWRHNFWAPRKRSDYRDVVIGWVFLYLTAEAQWFWISFYPGTSCGRGSELGDKARGWNNISWSHKSVTPVILVVMASGWNQNLWQGSNCICIYACIRTCICEITSADRTDQSLASSWQLVETSKETTAVVLPCISTLYLCLYWRPNNCVFPQNQSIEERKFNRI